MGQAAHSTVARPGKETPCERLEQLNRVDIQRPSDAARAGRLFDAGEQFRQQNMQRRPLPGLEQQLCPVAAGPALHWRRRGSENPNPRGGRFFRKRSAVLQERDRLVRLVGFGANQREVAKRWPASQLTLIQRGTGEGVIATADQILE